MQSGTSHDPDRKHLFIVCTDVCSEGKHLIVSITGWTNHLCDPTTRLVPGCHKFIHKESYVFFRKARIETAEALATGVDGGQFILSDPMDPIIVASILKGICDSIQTPRKVKKYAGCPAANSPSTAATPAAQGPQP
jgi:hypothetical protein